MKLDILAIAAHPDDIELGCAGTLIKHLKKGQKVGILDLTQGELGTNGTIESRYQEASAATKIMGVHIRENAQLRDGFFENNEENKLKIIQFIRKYQPNIVIANALDDRHPDHGRGALLIKDACFLAGLSKIKTYNDQGEEQIAWRPKRIFHMIQDRFSEPDFIVDISQEIDQKLAAIEAYTSQFYSKNAQNELTYISNPDFWEQLKSRSRMLGKRIGVSHGEGFHCENTLGLDDLDALKLPNLA